MAGFKIVISAALCGAAALALAACDNGPSAVAPKQAAGTQMATNTAADPGPSTAGSDGSRADHRQDPVKLVEGKPMWSASRRYSAEENAERAFQRNGEAFGADNLDEFVAKAHAFVDHPPRSALTLVRANGDTLIYDPKANVFAVRSKAGAPRTMFKPDDGMAYWEEQKAREAKRQTARRNRGADDEA
jgi:pyocin large subunit-like protein